LLLQVALDLIFPSPAGRLCHGAPACQQMDGKEHDSHDEGDVDKPRSNVKREKSQQPKHDQNRSKYPKHVFNSFYRELRDNQKSISQAQHGHPILVAFVLSFLMLPDRKSKICPV
jgi:hypothetical protein